MKVLVVDDDVDLLDYMSYTLRREGYCVEFATDGIQALARWKDEEPDIVLVDGNLPKIDGFEVCRRIRHEARTPVIMLTARGDEADVVRGLQVGADDYVTKPFSPKILSARMRAVLRRCQAHPIRQPEGAVTVGDLTLDVDTYEVTKTGRHVAITRTEFRILYLLAINEGRVVPHARLIEYAWGYFNERSSYLLKSHVSHIRRKLRLPSDDSGAIKAVAGVGYRLLRTAA